LLADSPVVYPFALLDAAKVESKDRTAMLMKGLGRLIDDLIVHRATEKRVRMADHGHKGWIGVGGGPEQGLETASWPWKKETAMEGLGHAFNLESFPRDYFGGACYA
jgi:hypothetical protein